MKVSIEPAIAKMADATIMRSFCWNSPMIKITIEIKLNIVVSPFFTERSEVNVNINGSVSVKVRIRVSLGNA